MPAKLIVSITSALIEFASEWMDGCSY